MFRTIEVSILEGPCRLERHESDLMQYITPWWWKRVMQESLLWNSLVRVSYEIKISDGSFR